MPGSLPTVEAVVKIPRGSRNKYEVDPATGQVRLDRVLFATVTYPGDYAFIPGTRAADGNPLEILVLVQEPTPPGCRIIVRPIGVLLMHDDKGTDEKLLGVPIADHRFAEVNDIDDLPKPWLADIGDFFEIYKTLEGKTASTEGWKGVAVAQQVLNRKWRAPSRRSQEAASRA